MAKQPAKGRKTATKPKKTPQKAPESAAPQKPVIDAIPAEVHAKSAPIPPKASEKAPETPKTPKKAADAAANQPAVKPAAPPPPPPAPAQKSSALPLVLGGLIAGVIGFGVANLSAPAADTTLATQVAAQSSAIAALEQRVDTIPAPDFSAVEAALAELSARIDAIESRPAPEAAPTGDVSAVGADLDALRAQIAEMTGAAQTELAEARAQAASIEENAAAAARNAAARAALARVQTSLESGAPIGAALGDLEDATGDAAPAGLMAAQDGVPTLATLQEEFPDAARAALATARSEGVAGEETTGFGAFLRNQLDVRSTAPRDGDSADAVLSRAEAAIRTGRLSDALAEVSALPEVARAAMSDWLAKAELRAGALDAADVLFSSLSDN